MKLSLLTKPVTAKIATVAALAGVLFWPIPYTAAPAWEVLVVDETGAPIEGMKVRLSYKNYSAESNNHEMDAITDFQGRVHFPIQNASASMARYVVFSARSALTGVHASFGRHATVFAFGQGRDGSATIGGMITDWTGSPEYTTSRIVARQRPRLE